MTMSISRRALDKKDGFDLAELRNVIDEAERAGLTGSASVRVTVGFRGQVQSIEVKG